MSELVPTPPSTNGEANGVATGRDVGGRFAAGNPGGPGNPHAADAGQQRARFFAALRNDDVEQALDTIRDVMRHGKNSERLTVLTQ